MAAGLNIAALARRTGVPPDTIRKWEQRYSVLRPERTPGGQRRYSAHDVARVEWLKARLDEGYRIGEAASLLGSAELTAAASVEELRDALGRAVLAHDVDGLVRFVQQTLSLNRLDEALVDVLAPMLASIGDRWEAGELTVAQEHLATGVVRAHLEKLLADARGGVRGTAVLACAPGERHELGLLMLAVLLRADGWQVAFLGADTPVEDAVDVASELGARVLGISATMPESASAATRGLRAAHPPEELAVIFGGRAVVGDEAHDVGAHSVVGDLRASVSALRKLA
jgi:methanogenic corrinoid protein MtbC1